METWWLLCDGYRQNTLLGRAQNGPRFILSDFDARRWIGRGLGGPVWKWKHASYVGNCVLFPFPCRLIGTATVALKDLIGNQSRSLPYKLISLLNERGQETGVSISLLLNGFEGRWLCKGSLRQECEIISSSLHTHTHTLPTGFEVNRCIYKWYGLILYSYWQNYKVDKLDFLYQNTVAWVGPSLGTALGIFTWLLTFVWWV